MASFEGRSFGVSYDQHPNLYHSINTSVSSHSEDKLNSVEDEYVNLMTLDFNRKCIVHKWHMLQSCIDIVPARSKHTTVSWDGGIYTFGGDDGKKMLNDLLMFRVDQKSWDRVYTWGSPPSPRYHHSAVVYKDSMFVFGGYTGDTSAQLRNQNDLLEFKFINRHWVDWSDVIRDRYPASRSAHGSCVHQNWLYVFAGYDGTTRLNDMWRINISAHTAVQWECVRQVGESPPTCCNFPMATIKDNMYVFSGQSGAKITNNLYRFSFPEQTWTKIQTEYLLRFGPYPPQRRYGHTMVAHGDSLYVFGGSADGTLPNELHKFDVESCSWEKIDPAPGSQIPNGRLFHSAAIQGNRMYIFGGMIDSSPIRLSDLFSFHIANYPKCTLPYDFANLLKKEEFCDLKFIVGKHGEVVWAHVAVVAARSPYLRKQLLSSGNFSKPGPDGIQSQEISTLTLSDQDAEAFKIALHFLYTDHILWPRSATDDTISRLRNLKCLLELTKLAIILETEKLEKLCIHYIENAVCVDNVLSLLISAHELYLNHLKEYCIKFVVRDGHYQQVVMLPEFDSLESGLVVEIVRKQLKQSRGQQIQEQYSSECSYNPSALTPQFYPSLESDLKAFLEDLGSQFADILLQIGPTSFPAHKCILAARCKYFEAMFRSFMPTDAKVNITFGQIEPSCQSFKTLLNYMYYAEIKMLPEDALYIFQAPNFFGFSNCRLQVFCKEALEQKIGRENVINLLRISSEIGVEEVKKYTLDRIVGNFHKVFDMADFQDLSKDLLLDILEALAKCNT